jgi:hypothetical protein
VIDLLTNATYYETVHINTFAQIEGSIQNACKNWSYSEIYEVAGLSNVLRCNIHSVYPRIASMPHNTDFFNTDSYNIVFKPVPPATANHTIAVLWSNMRYENVVRASRDGFWNPNHFVPIVLPVVHNESGHYNKSTSNNIVSYSFAR